MNLDFTNIERYLDEIKSGKKYVCFGAGRFFYDFINKYCGDDLKIVKPAYVCDNNSKLWGKTVFGVQIVSPEKLLEEEPENIIIVVSAGVPYSIMADLFSLKLQRHYYCILHLSQFDTYFYCKENLNKLREVYDCFSDKKSKKHYEKHFQLTLDGTLNYSSIFTPNAYWNNDLVERLMDGENVLYAGAFDGKHVDRALQNNPNITFHGFEPNKEMFDKLVEKYKGFKNVKLYPYALSDHKEIFDFDPTVALGAMVVKADKSGGVRVSADLEKVESNTIDSAVGNQLDLIALDVEGLEIDALNGSVETIKKYKPKLTICVYHRVEHYAEIPLLIKKINPNYQLYFRHHSVDAIESVVYAL